MTRPEPVYDLTLLLDPQAEEAARARIVAETRSSIESQGQLLRHDEWGERPLAYPIRRRASAEYHLMQFHAGSPALLTSLDHALQIADGILRFRIIKLRPGVPDAPDMRASQTASRGEGERRPPEREEASEAPAPAVAETA